MTRGERYTVGSDDGRSISFQKEEGAFVGIDFTLKFRHVISVAVIVAAVAGGKHYMSTMDFNDVTTVVQELQSVSVPMVADEPIDSNGYVFANSSKEVLTEALVMNLIDEETVGFQRLLRMSINEIYARHGQIFTVGGENDVHYQCYDWYKETSKHIVDWDEFSEIEKTNLRLLISIEEEYGYR